MGKFGLNFFKPTEKFNGNWSVLDSKSREWEKMYRERWSHDKVVRTTHGVNCTGSCSWKVFVKNGVITWENQQTDYPSCGPDMPEFEPRGCPRGASFSWYEYSPLRVKYPYIRGVLLDLWREALVENNGNRIAAWASIVEDETKAKKYKEARGMGATSDRIGAMSQTLSQHKFYIRLKKMVLTELQDSLLYLQCL